MNLFFKAALSMAALLTIATATAQGSENELTTEQQIAQLSAELQAIKADVAESKAANEKLAKSDSQSKFYAPKISGSVFSTFSVSGYNASTRFNVRNARFAIKGNAAKNMIYAMQIDFHNQGSINVMDAYVRYHRPTFDVSLGQQQIHLSTELDRGPHNYLTNTRSFSSILSTSYYNISDDGIYSTGSFGSRDIGAYANYYFKTKVPVTISGGAYNGLGINDVEWSNRMNFVTRVMVGNSEEGLYGGGSYYWGDNVMSHNVNIITTELSYKKNNFFVEGLYQQRRLNYDGKQVMQFGLVQGYYTIPTKESRFLEYLTPTLRWDCGNNMEYLNIENEIVELYNVNRFTPQLNIGFKGEKVRSHVGVSYEWMIKNATPSDIKENPFFQDKFTISFVAAF